MTWWRKISNKKNFVKLSLEHSKKRKTLYSHVRCTCLLNVVQHSRSSVRNCLSGKIYFNVLKNWDQKFDTIKILASKNFFINQLNLFFVPQTHLEHLVSHFNFFLNEKTFAKKIVLRKCNAALNEIFPIEDIWF